MCLDARSARNAPAAVSSASPTSMATAATTSRPRPTAAKCATSTFASSAFGGTARLAAATSVMRSARTAPATAPTTPSERTS
eukprot:2087895-Prymnesium_polylepis.4